MQTMSQANDPVIGSTVDYFDGTEDAAPAATLERLSDLAQEAQTLEKEIAEETDATAKKSNRLNRILSEFIPNIMDELGLKDFTLKDGTKIDVKDDVKCSLSEDRKPEALKWLRENNFDGIIKSVVNAEFGRGELEQADKAIEELYKLGISAEMKESVHPSTLKSFVKEQLENGNTNLPLKVFGVFEYKVAKLKLPKGKK